MTSPEAGEGRPQPCDIDDAAYPVSPEVLRLKLAAYLASHTPQEIVDRVQAITDHLAQQEGESTVDGSTIAAEETFRL